MLLQWTQHPTSISTRLADLLERGRLLDVKLAGEGGVVRAHRVVLAAASEYFEQLLEDCTDHLPTIFFRDVTVLDLEKIVQYIYTGDCQVSGPSLQSFLCLARSLGLPEFIEQQSDQKTTPSKRKFDRGDGGKENRRPGPSSTTRPPTSSPRRAPTTPGKSASEPATLEATLDTPGTPGTPGSATKKRRLITQSLDQLPPPSSNQSQSLVDHNHQHPPSTNHHGPTISCPAQPLYANMPNMPNMPSTLPSPTVSTHHFPPLREIPLQSLGANAKQNLPLREIPPQKFGVNLQHNLPLQEPLYSNLPPSPRPNPPLYENLSSQKSKSKVSLFPSDPVFKVPLPPGPLQGSRPPDSPLKVPPSSAGASPRHAPTSSCPAPPSPALPLPPTSPHHAPNFSFDSHFLDPEELAAKGATLLHHLAVWMIQQRREEGSTVPPTSLVGDELPPPEDTSTPPLTAKGSSSPRSWDGSHGLGLSKGRSPRSWDGGNLSTPPPKTSSLPRPPTGMRDIGKSEADRPDSGFDSKDGEEEDVSREEAKEEGSPEVGEISRQAVARQPVKKKKMFSMSSIQ